MMFLLSPTWSPPYRSSTNLAREGPLQVVVNQRPPHALRMRLPYKLNHASCFKTTERLCAYMAHFLHSGARATAIYTLHYRVNVRTQTLNFACRSATSPTKQSMLGKCCCGCSWTSCPPGRFHASNKVCCTWYEARTKPIHAYSRLCHCSLYSRLHHGVFSVNTKNADGVISKGIHLYLLNGRMPLARGVPQVELFRDCRACMSSPTGSCCCC